MLRWVCQQSPKSQTISQVFDSPKLIIKAVIEMTPEVEKLKIALGELFENLRSSTIVQSKNGGSKRGREVVNDEDDFKKRQLTSIKSDIDELKGMMSTILKHIRLQRKGDEGDHKVFEGLVNHTLESEEVDNAKTEDVDTGGTPNWLRMPKKDKISNGAKHIELKKKGNEDVHTIGTPPWLRFNIELEKSINVLEKKVDIGLEEPIDVVDDEVKIEDSGKKLCTHFDSDVTKIEPFPTQRPHVRPARRKRARGYLSTPFTTLPKRSVTSTTTTSQCEPIVYDPVHKILDIKAVGIPSAQNFTTADTIFMVWNRHVTLSHFSCLRIACLTERKSIGWLTMLSGQKRTFKILGQVLITFTLHSMSMSTIGFYYTWIWRGRSSTYKEPWPVVIVDSIPLQRNNSDCDVFIIKYFEYIAAGVGLDTLCQENMSYFRKQLAFELWTNTLMY
ncbi:Ulp1-like peptidase [Cucumis melo var. makuwa]|uniref:Ulp1-like peptidase n=1 Tax=Cucumis melo var. makuwa TaxID=1194695 RepID=A0A5A7SZ68_CUCMM|nr:Ulp1-like peptidase [Cucumis melo var. makuwa]